MKRFLLAALLLLVPTVGWALGNTNTVPPACTVANIATCVPQVKGTVVRVVDGATAIDCETTGGGSTVNICQYDGSNWVVAPPSENSIGADEYAVMSDKIVVCGQLIDTGHTNTWVGPAVAEYLGNGTEWAIGGTACNAYDSETNSAGADEVISAFFPAFKVTGMQCILSGDPTNDVVITLNSATAVLTPSITCTVAGTGAGQGCSTVTSTTTDVAAGATISAAIVYSEDLDAEDVWCQVYFAIKAS